LEERVDAVEQELAQLEQRLKAETPPAPLHWWEKIAGTFARSEHYDEAMRLAREYRESLRHKNDTDKYHDYHTGR
jgi:hypothetical protein